MNIPIVFIHMGNSSYLKYSLSQACKSNPGTDVVMLGDDANAVYNFIKHEKIRLDGAANHFIKIYKHMSPNGYDYELFCYLRWFILAEYMERNGVERCYYQDSDVMLYSDINKEIFQNYNCALVTGMGISSFLSLNVLRRFCAFTIEAYQSEKYINEFIQICKTYSEQGIPAGISDMTLWRMFVQKYPEEFCELTEVDKSGAVFNHNIIDGFPYENIGGYLNVYILDGRPILYNKEINRYIGLHSLHFQGLAKQYMQYFEQFNYIEEDMAFYFDYAALQWKKEHVTHLYRDNSFAVIRELFSDGRIDAVTAKLMNTAIGSYLIAQNRIDLSNLR